MHMVISIRQLVSNVIPQGVKNAIVDIRDPIEAFAHGRNPRIPPPHAVKVRAVINQARGHNVRVLVETGTCLGEMARKCSKHFRQIWTIELSETLAAEAARRLARLRNVHVLCGGSSRLLPQILGGIHEPVVFWLDAHYSGGVTAKGATECPLEDELKIIAEQTSRDHIILIDDVRMMGSGDFPSLERVCELASRINPRYRIEVRDDIVVCEPPENGIAKTNWKQRIIMQSPTPEISTLPADRSSGPWERVWPALAIPEPELVAVSHSDPSRRTYRSGQLLYKIVLVEYESSSRVRAQSLTGEYAMLRRCSGVPGIPRVFAVMQKPGIDCLSMAFVDGTLLEERQLSLRAFAVVAFLLARTLLGLSVRGVAHNDVLPTNVIVSNNNLPYLIDFDQAVLTTPLNAMMLNFLGNGRSEAMVHNGLLQFLIIMTKRSLPRRVASFLRIAFRRRMQQSGHRLPDLQKGASPTLIKLHQAWALAQLSDASSPGRRIAYYSFNWEGVHLPGERPWLSRWDAICTAADFRGKRILELGCNMALLSIHLLKYSGASAALGVDRCPDILKSGRLAAEGFDVNLQLDTVDFDKDANWEGRLLEFRPDVLFCLNVLNWVQDKRRLLRFLDSAPELFYEGHDSRQVEMERLQLMRFDSVRVIAVTERKREIFYCRRGV
jgi:predicted Ser/Thr protein kinase/SAM-dependent methyltransferase